MKKTKARCVCDGSGYFTNPFDQKYKCEAHKLKKQKEISLPKLKKKAWKILSEYRRSKEANLDGYAECVTCKNPTPLPWRKLQGGHFVPGRRGWIFLNEDCVWPQCFVCNIKLKGNWANYYEFMVEKFGIKKVSALIALKNKEMSSTEMRDECERIINTYGGITRAFGKTNLD